MAKLNSEIKTAIKNALLHFSDKDFNPQSFLDILCAECRNIGIKFDECDWFSAWSAKFEGAIRKELARNPIKTRDDFIDKIAQIMKNRHDSSEILRVLEKSLRLLREKNIIDFSEKMPLNIIDSKLSVLLSSDKMAIESCDDFLQKVQNFGAIPQKKEILLCVLKVDKKLDSRAFEKLLNSSAMILINHLDAKNIIGIYKNTIAILPRSEAKSLQSKVESALKNRTFIFRNKPLRLKIDFKILPFGSLK